MIPYDFQKEALRAYWAPRWFRKTHDLAKIRETVRQISELANHRG
jgi:hypothetical protein